VIPVLFAMPKDRPGWRERRKGFGNNPLMKEIGKFNAQEFTQLLGRVAKSTEAILGGSSPWMLAIVPGGDTARGVLTCGNCTQTTQIQIIEMVHESLANVQSVDLGSHAYNAETGQVFTRADMPDGTLERELLIARERIRVLEARVRELEAN
jgi:hypothetical protein